MAMVVGDIRTFPNCTADKEQVLKIGEEAMEVFSAWEDLMYPESRTHFHYLDPRYRKLVDECADVLMATCNLLAGLGISDITEVVKRCEKRNEERGRYEVQE